MKIALQLKKEGCVILFINILASSQAKELVTEKGLLYDAGINIC